MIRSSISLWAIVLLLGALLPPSARAQTDDVQPERLNWIYLPGHAGEDRDISVSGDGSAFVIDPRGQALTGIGGRWTYLFSEKFKRIDAAPGGGAWAVDEAGNVFRYRKGSRWELITVRRNGTGQGVTAIDVGVGAEGSVYIVDATGKVEFIDDSRGNTELASTPIPDPPISAQRIDVDNRGLPWVVMTDHAMARYNGKAWERLPGEAIDISVGPEGTAYMVDPNQHLQRWDSKASRWRQLDELVAMIAVGPRGQPWVVRLNGSIQATEVLNVALPESRAGLKPRNQELNWRSVKGVAQVIVANARGDVFALDSESRIWEWKGKKRWSTVAGRLERIAVDPKGVLWGINAAGHVMHRPGSFLDEASGVPAAGDIAFGINGSMWILLTDGTPQVLDTVRGVWQTIPGDMKGKRIAVDGDGLPWIVTDDGSVYRHDGKKWIEVQGIKARNLTFAADNTPYAAGVDHRPYRYDYTSSSWDQLNWDQKVFGDVDSIAVANVSPWVTSANAAIYTTANPEEEHTNDPSPISAQSRPADKSAVGAVAPRAILNTLSPTPGTLEFKLVSGQARDISIGLDGSVFIVGYDSNVYRWNNTQNKFLQFPGALLRIAVGPDGKPWGVTTDGHVFHHDGTDWRLVQGISNVIDIAIGANGSVMVTDGSKLYRYNSVAAGFQQFFTANGYSLPANNPKRLAVDRNGSPWVVTADNKLYRCDIEPCAIVPAVSALNVGIGPEDTVIVVDTDRLLRRHSPNASQFELISAPNVQGSDSVAVGLRGQPWVVTANNQVFATAFFPRDESNDLAVAQRTVQPTTVASTNNSALSAPVFVFTQSPVLVAVSSSAPIAHLTIGANGTVSGIDVTGTQILTYNAGTNTFAVDNALSTLPAPIQTPLHDIAIAPDGTVWISDALNAVYRRSGNSYVNVRGLTSNTGMPSPVSLSISASGTVFATSADDTLFQYAPSSQTFLRYSPQPPSPGAFLVRVDPYGNPWVLSPPLGAVRALVGGVWVNRNIQAGPMSIGANGSVYVIDATTGKLKRWNNTNQYFDNITTPSPLLDVAAGPDGRIWVIAPGFQILRAK